MGNQGWFQQHQIESLRSRLCREKQSDLITASDMGDCFVPNETTGLAMTNTFVVKWALLLFISGDAHLDHELLVNTVAARCDVGPVRIRRKENEKRFRVCRKQ